MKSAAVCALGAASALFASCGADESATPRRRAYQRIEAYDSAYVAVDSLPVRLLANSSARVSRPRPDWVNIIYPRYNATVFISVTAASPDDIPSVVDNRTERIGLNIGDATAVKSTVTDNGGFISTLYEAPAAVATPLQFVATDSRRYVVSGSVFFNNAGDIGSMDSVAPVVAAIRRDLVVALDSLR